jgi:hypothetical protein
MNEELRRALRRVEPPEGFADRVIERASKHGLASPKPAVAPKALWRATAGAIAATLALATIGGGLWYRAEERHRQEGEAAKRQVLLSLGIAGSKLHAIAMKVNHEEER